MDHRGALRWLREGMSPWRGLSDGPVCDELGRTPVDGLYVTGDLAGTTLIPHAVAHGTALGEHLAASLPSSSEDHHDVIVIGGGPAGAACALALQDAGRRHLVLERSRPFDTLDRFPRGKVLYARPAPDGASTPLTFDDAPKEAVVEDWRRALHDRAVHLYEGIEVLDAHRQGDHWVVTARRRDDDTRRTLTARAVVVAVGRRGQPRTLDVPGEDAPHVHHELHTPDAWAERSVLVVGGGDSATEAAVQLAEAGARVTLAYRGARLTRPKRANREAVRRAAEQGPLDVLLRAQPVRIGPTTVVLRQGDGEREVDAEAVFVLIGSDPPLGLLERLGLPLRSERSWRHTAGIAAFIGFVWCFYLLKTGRAWFPLHPDGPLSGVADALTVTVPWWPTVQGPGRTFGPGFWGTVLYSAAILVAGVAAMRRHDTAVQRRRYLSLIGFQWVFLFGVPELLAPLVTTTSSALYSLSVPWPLRIDSLTHGPSAVGWLVVGALTSFVAIPWYVRRRNEQFCSYLCGCGGLAETVGDLWRVYAPRGDLARKAEGAGRWILLAAIPITLLVLADTWALVTPTTWLDDTIRVEADGAEVVGQASPEAPGHMAVSSATLRDGALEFAIAKRQPDGRLTPDGWTSGLVIDGETVWPSPLEPGRYRLPLAGRDLPLRVQVQATSSPLSRPADFARGWYGLMVDFWLASIVGVALYPLLGNRVWCRFFCPLRAWMELIAARFGRLAIVSDETCISCGSCTTACQMGIDVQGFAEDRIQLDNANSACIQCGVCVEVCPMDTLTLVDRHDEGLPLGPVAPVGPRWGVPPPEEEEAVPSRG